MSELLTVRDVVTVLKCGEDAVVRRFAKMPGVIDLGKPETRSRRRYRVLRIPKVVVEQYLTRKSGRSIQIEVPPRAERRRRSATWENRAILNLAKAALQNECRDRKAYRRMADRARILTAHRDACLDRKVAIKSLPESFANDAYGWSGLFFARWTIRI